MANIDAIIESKRAKRELEAGADGGNDDDDDDVVDVDVVDDVVVVGVILSIAIDGVIIGVRDGVVVTIDIPFVIVALALGTRRRTTTSSANNLNFRGIF